MEEVYDEFRLAEGIGILCRLIITKSKVYRMTGTKELDF